MTAMIVCALVLPIPVTSWITWDACFSSGFIKLSISSWAGLCPGDNVSAKKRKSGKIRKGNALLKSTLVLCAHAAVRHKSSYFHAQFKRISTHRGKKRAYVAVAHSILIAIYHILKDGVKYQDLGAEYYNQFNAERKIHAYLKKLKALGWEPPKEAVPA